ncbi:MAG: hypothetical protein HYY05_08965 [Chloroflexi bacterium]|nr:hypothetical protein [Chloroflexota bacterium]
MRITLRRRNGTLMTPAGPIEADVLVARETVASLISRELDAIGATVPTRR